MRHEKILIGLFAAATLVGASAASAQSPDSPGHLRLTSTLTEQDYSMSLSPTRVRAGGTISVEVVSRYPLDSGCGGQATSPGFARPITLDFASHTVHAGKGPVIDIPGRYQVTVPCTSGTPITGAFDIVGGQQTSPPPLSPPVDPPPPYVTPVGPPQTGGGGTS